MTATGARSNVLKENLEDRHQVTVVQRARCDPCRLLYQWEQAVLIVRMPVEVPTS